MLLLFPTGKIIGIDRLDLQKKMIRLKMEEKNNKITRRDIVKGFATVPLPEHYYTVGTERKNMIGLFRDALQEEVKLSLKTLYQKVSYPMRSKFDRDYWNRRKR